jgi:hypothetical protein
VYIEPPYTSPFLILRVNIEDPAALLSLVLCTTISYGILETANYSSIPYVDKHIDPWYGAAIYSF